MAAEALLFPGQGSHADGMEDPYRGNALLERGLELLGDDPFVRLDEGTRTQQPALLLCSDLGSFITGQVIIADGGLTPH